jgi:hypothetical protein
VGAFVGDLTFAELLDKHGVRAIKTKGGWKPSAWYVDKYVVNNQHLRGIPFSDWRDEDKEKFKEWFADESEGDKEEGLRLGALGSWHTIREKLIEHGLQRKSYTLLAKAEMQEVHDVLAEVCKGIGKALKG